MPNGCRRECSITAVMRRVKSRVVGRASENRTPGAAGLARDLVFASR